MASYEFPRASQNAVEKNPLQNTILKNSIITKNNESVDSDNIVNDDFQKVKEPKNIFKNKSTKEEFFIVCNGLELWQVVEQVSKYFNQNILVYNDIKNRKIHATVQGANLKDVLECLTWLLGIEYVEQDGIIFLGSNTAKVLVVPSSGIDKDIEKVFKDVTISQIGDKLIIYGQERDVARVKEAYKKLVKRDYTIVHLYAIEVQYDRNIELGLDIDKSISYAFSWESMMQNQFNPMQSLAMTIKASIVIDKNNLNISSLIDTDIGLISGREIFIQIGEDWDRPLYSVNEFGIQTISGYSVQRTGLILKLKGFYDENDWYIDFFAENSKSLTEFKKTLTSVNTVAKLSKEKPFQVLASINLGQTKQAYTKGIPFLCDIPILGYLFRITSEREYSNKIVFVLQLKDKMEIEEITHVKAYPLTKISNFIAEAPEKALKALRGLP